MIEPFLKFRLYNEGIHPTIAFGDYDVISQELLDESSVLTQLKPDLLVLSLLLENMVPKHLDSNIDFESIIANLEQIYSLCMGKHSLVAVNTFIPPFYPEYGLARPPHLNRMDDVIKKINLFVRDYVSNHHSQFILLDWERYVQILGEEASIDYRYWYSSKAPFKISFLDLYAQEITNIIRSLKGRTKKCVVLDCDNTLWGGIIGEDGLQGIKLHNYDYPGKAYYDFQKNLIYLHERGVLLTICSKNNEEDVWEVMGKHPSSLLKRSYLAGWRINWQDKVSNIKALVDELNIGMDSIVFVDDNPMECDLVKQYLPEVKVIQVPKQLYTYPSILLREGLFDTLTISREDSIRTEMYQAETLRKTEQGKFSNLEDYLSSLELKVIIHPAKAEEIQRIAQLTQKTNQFNLTTRRYSEADIMHFADDDNYDVYSLTVKDKFGDYGLTGVFIGNWDTNQYRVDSLLLSCRVLGRKVEQAFVNECIKSVMNKRPIYVFLTEYIPTLKNKQVENFWDSLGFQVIENNNGTKLYKLEEKAITENIEFITIVGEE